MISLVRAKLALDLGLTLMLTLTLWPLILMLWPLMLMLWVRLALPPMMNRGRGLERQVLA